MLFSEKNISVKTKLTLSVLLTLVIIISIGFGFIMARDIERLRNGLVDETRTYNNLLSQDLVRIVTFGSVDLAADITSRLRTLLKIQGLTLYNINRDPIFYYQQQGIGAISSLPEKWQHQYEFKNDYLLLFMPLTYQKAEYGHVLIQVSTTNINQTLSNYFQQGGVILLAMIFSSLAFSWLLQRHFTRPIQQLSSTLHTIAKNSDFSIRLPVSNNDEIGDLFNGFNVMQEQIQLANKALQDRQFALDQHAIVAITDVKGSITYANEKFSEISGYSFDELIGQNHRLLKSGVHTTEFFKEMYDVITSGNVWQGDICNRNKAGNTYWVQTTIVPLMNVNGKPESYISMRTDITPRKKAEENLSRAQKMTHLGSWELDLISYELNWSNEVFRIFEIDSKKFKASYDAFINAIHPDDRERVNQAYSESISNRLPYTIEHRLLMKDGRIKYVNERCETFYSDSGKPVKSIGTVHDITESKDAEDALRRSQKMDAMGQLTGGIAHDFNNIMGIILGNIELLELQAISDEKIKKRLVPIRKSAERAVKLTKQLLGFSRRKPKQMAITDINQQIDEMESLITHSITPQVEVEHNLAKDLWKTETDPGDFQDALINLILNARDAMEGSGHLTLETSNVLLDEKYCSHNPGVSQGEYVLIIVSDSGKGISPEEQECIFDPFYTTKPEGKGTGLGLSMVFGFTQRSNGHIKVYSESGIGTTFRLYLPRAEGSRLVRETNVSSEESLSRGTEKVLVVDDEEGLRTLACDSLEELGYEVLLANDARQALQELKKHPDINLLFSDVVMPGGINGFELAEQASEMYPQLKILLTSGYTQNAMARNGQVRFESDLLTKPYSRSDLSDRVREMLDRPV